MRTISTTRGCSTMFALVILGGAFVPGVQAAERPGFHVLRFEEDWSGVAEYAEEGRADAIKHVTLDDRGDVWVSFGGQLRERVEGWHDFNFGDTGGADSGDVFLLSRLRTHADLHLGANVRMFAEMISALATDRDLPGGRRTADVDELDLENGFLEVSVAPEPESTLRLRAGRQELLFGQQRLVSPLDWSNTRRQFDGVTVDWIGELWRATGFWSHLVDKEKYDFNDTDEDNELYGIYATAHPAGIGQIDLYWLALNRHDAAINGSTGNENRHTLGARVHGLIADSDLDYDVEGAWQGGEVGSADINAGMVSVTAGADCKDDMHGRLELGFDYASGDDDPADGEVQTFNQLFPLGHKYLGHADVIGRQNVIAVRGSAAANVVANARLIFDVHYFRRASDDDAVYNAAGGVLRPGAAGGSNDVGVELDLSLKIPVSAYTVLELGYAHFFAGDFIDQAGSSDDLDFGYLSFQYTL